MSKVCYIDVETTGTNAFKHGIWQLAFILEIDGKIQEEQAHKMKPFNSKEIELDALKVGGISKEDLATFEDPRNCFQYVLETWGKYIDRFDKQDKMAFVAYNSPFDNRFLRAWFKDNGDQYFGSWFSGEICVMRKFNDFIITTGSEEPENRKLQTAAQYMGLNTDTIDWHDARADVAITRELYYKLNHETREYYNA